MKSFLLTLAVLFCAVLAHAQAGVRFDSQVTQVATIVTTTNAVVVPAGPIVKICNAPANAVPCSNLATTYTDATLGTPCSTSTQIVLSGTTTCVNSPDAQNNWGVWVAGGQYTYTVTVGGSNYGPYYFTAGGSGGGGGGTLTSITFSGPLTSSPNPATTVATASCPTCAVGTGPFTNNQLIAGAGGQNISPIDLTGPVTTSGSNTTSIANNAITTATIAANAVTEPKLGFSNVTTANATTSAHGLLPILPGVTSPAEYLDSTGAYSVPPSVNGKAIYASQYGVQANVNFAIDASWTTSSTTVTIQNSGSAIPTPNFQCPGAVYPCSSGGDVGSIIFGTNMQFGNWNNNDVLQVPQGTIISIQSTTQATVSSAATGTCTSVNTGVGAQCFLAWGQTNDTADLEAAFVAATTAGTCGTLVLPQGAMFINDAIYNSAANACGTSDFGVANFGSGMKTGFAVIGQGLAQSILVILPSFTSTHCTVQHTCFFSSSNNSGTYLHDFGIIGGYNHTVGANDAAISLENNAIGDHIAVLALGLNIGLNLGGAEGITSICNYCLFEGAAATVSGVQGYSLVVTGGGNVITNSTINDGYAYAAFDIAGNLDSRDTNFGEAQCNPCYSLSSGKTWTTTNDIFGDNAINSATVFENAGTFIPQNDQFLDGSNNVVLFENQSGGVVLASNTKWLEAGSTPTAFKNDSGASAVDQGCCNTFTGAVINSGSWFKDTSVTGTALTSAKWSVPAGSSTGEWGTSPSVATCSGATKWQQCTITVGSSTVGSDPVLTVTFPTPFPIPPLGCVATQVGGTQSNNAFVTGTVTATAAAFTYQATPSASDTLIVQITGCIIP